MNLTLPKRGIVEALSHIERIIPKQPSNPVYSQVHMRLSDDTLRLVGSNGEVDILAELNVDGPDEGKWSVPATPFARVLKACPGELVVLKFDKNRVHIASGSYENNLQLTTGELSIPFADHYKHEVSGLAEALESVIYAADSGDGYGVFRGVLFQLGETSRVVATDSFRLAYHSLDLEGDIEAVVPASALAILSRLLDDTARVNLTKEKLEVQTGNYQLNIRTMEGSFPDWERVIPTQFAARITVDAGELAERLERVSVMADSGANNRIDLIIQGENLTITTEGGFGDSQERLQVKHEGEDMNLAYNARYLIDPISRINGQVELAFSGAASPTIIRPDESRLAMVVPLKVG